VIIKESFNELSHQCVCARAFTITCTFKYNYITVFDVFPECICLAEFHLKTIEFKSILKCVIIIMMMNMNIICVAK